MNNASSLPLSAAIDRHPVAAEHREGYERDLYADSRFVVLGVLTRASMIVSTRAEESALTTRFLNENALGQ
ncbi:hypothetical protein ACFT8V_16745 [Streptomyces griseoincarnatus]